MSTENDDANLDNTSQHSTAPLAYRRIRVPQKHGQVLHLPDSHLWNDIWQNNCKLRFEQSRFQTNSLSLIRELGRKELADAALAFTRQYRDIEVSGRDVKRIILGGHQPSLFHPGVWYKNFVLDNVGRKLRGLPVNLIVDNDICHSTHVNVPCREIRSQQWYFKRVHYDVSQPAVAYENRAIIDSGKFREFGSLLSREIEALVSQPIVRRLWPYVLENQGEGNLGLALAKGRHRFEQDLRLQTLELPISSIARFTSFAGFVKEVLVRHKELQAIYNATIKSYRQIHRIKNKAQPLPELATQDSWVETPFWIWNQQSPQRRSMFVRSAEGMIEVSDMRTIRWRFCKDGDIASFRDQLVSKQCVRPKALMTTLFSRLVSSDLFIHGIGGSKYDQLTDEIARRFFHVQLPEYLTVSGTFRIESDRSLVGHDDLMNLQNSIRELRFHPERFIENPDFAAAACIDSKRHWINQQLPVGNRLPRHRAINDTNQKLQSYVSEISDALKQRQVTMRQQVLDSKILGARELSFCLHDLSLVDSLAEQICNAL